MNGIVGFSAPGHTLDGLGGSIHIADRDDTGLDGAGPNGIVGPAELEASTAASIVRRLETSVDYSAEGQTHPAPGKLSVHDAAVLVAGLSDHRLAQLFNLALRSNDGVDRPRLFTNALFAAMGPRAAEHYSRIASLAQTLGEPIEVRQRGFDHWIGQLDMHARTDVLAQVNAQWHPHSLIELATTVLPPALPRAQCLDDEAARAQAGENTFEAVLDRFRKPLAPTPPLRSVSP